MINLFFKYYSSLLDYIRRIIRALYTPWLYKSRIGKVGKNVYIRNNRPCPTSVLARVELEDNVRLNAFTIISSGGKFIMKKNSGTSSGLTIINGNHNREIGVPMTVSSKKKSVDVDRDIIVEEDVWIGANVTLCSGAHIGRGATIGAGAVVRSKVPPYAIVYGNPAKVIGFCFTPDEVIEHESKIYREEERLSRDLLEKNYNKFFLKRIKEIKQFVSL